MADKSERGFYLKNTVEVVVNGVKRRVNKFEAEKLEAKLAKLKKSK